LLDQPRRALDVGDEKGDGAGRKLPHPLIICERRSGYKLVQTVASTSNSCEYEWEYGLVSTSCSSLQFVAAMNSGICSHFQFVAVRCGLFTRTFNPKVAGSIPARPNTSRSVKPIPNR